MDVSINGARILHTFENVPLLGSVQITQTLAVSWLVMAIITGLCIWLGSGLKVTNISRKQAVAEMGYNAIVNFVRGNRVRSLTDTSLLCVQSLSPASSPT